MLRIDFIYLLYINILNSTLPHAAILKYTVWNIPLEWEQALCLRHYRPKASQTTSNQTLIFFKKIPFWWIWMTLPSTPTMYSTIKIPCDSNKPIETVEVPSINSGSNDSNISDHCGKFTTSSDTFEGRRILRLFARSWSWARCLGFGNSWFVVAPHFPSWYSYSSCPQHSSFAA